MSKRVLIVATDGFEQSELEGPKKALEDAGMDLPEPTYRVQLMQPAAHADTAPAQTPPITSVDPRAVARDQGDVSPETELDDQIAEERARKASEDMLQAPGGKPG